MANASIAENLAASGANAYSNLPPFEYDLGEGVEIQLFSTWTPVSGLTWSQLQTIVRGLWMYHIQGKRYQASVFEVFDYDHDYIYPLAGRGVIRPPAQSIAENSSLRAISKKDLRPQ